ARRRGTLPHPRGDDGGGPGLAGVASSPHGGRMTARAGFAAVLLAACGVAGPVPLEWEQAGCTHCHMTLADRRFGAEIVTTKGRALAFDDAGCAAEALAARELGLDEVSSVWVIDFTHPDSLISAGSATFVRSKEFKTPMGS